MSQDPLAMAGIIGGAVVGAGIVVFGIVAGILWILGKGLYEAAKLFYGLFAPTQQVAEDLAAALKVEMDNMPDIPDLKHHELQQVIFSVNRLFEEWSMFLRSAESFANKVRYLLGAATGAALSETEKISFFAKAREVVAEYPALHARLQRLAASTSTGIQKVENELAQITTSRQAVDASLSIPIEHSGYFDETNKRIRLLRHSLAHYLSSSREEVDKVCSTTSQEKIEEACQAGGLKGGGSELDSLIAPQI